MLGLTNTVLTMLTKLRELEFDAYQKARSLLVWVLLISNVMCKSGRTLCYASTYLCRNISVFVTL